MPSNIEQFAANHCLHINQYHADNGHFANNAFRKHSSQQWQIVSFCNVNAHFQNEIAYREIKGVTKSAKIMLIHAKTWWPSAAHLCSCGHMQSGRLYTSITLLQFYLMEGHILSYMVWCQWGSLHRRQSSFWVSSVFSTEWSCHRQYNT